MAALCCEFHDADAEDVQCCDECPLDESTQDVPAAAPAEGLDVHAALNTYESPGHEPTIVAVPAGVDVHGANGRRLLVREMDDGVWIGGCLISDPFVLGALVSYLQTRADAL